MTTESTRATAEVAIDEEMDAIIYYLTAFAHIDGSYDREEQKYIEQFITKLTGYRARIALKDKSPAEREAETARWTKHFQEIFAQTEKTIQSHFTESVAEGENSAEFVFAKLKLRCYELFQRVPPDHQEKLLLLADELSQADGVVHPNEEKFHAELKELLASKEPVKEAAKEHGPESAAPGSSGQASAGVPSQPAPESAKSDPAGPQRIKINPPATLRARLDDYDFFRAFERHYPTDKAEFDALVQGDLVVLDRAVAAWDAQREKGKDKLSGKFGRGGLAGEKPFLDGHVYVIDPEPKKEYELLVLGDLHGCYSCLKAALMQADFFAKVDAHHLDPKKPEMKLVLLGDYIDRGIFSYNGILRTALQLFLIAPEHVYVLRGNHEYYVELNGRVYGGVRPAEAIQSLQGRAAEDVFRAYKRLFEAMPSMLLFGEMMFVHAGIPREDTLAEKWFDLSSLNDPDMRFQMMWSDPSEAEFIPLDLQKATARFPFGHRQWKSFMDRIGCSVMVRGHERIVEGFKPVYQGEGGTLINLFSSGGADNKDLPADSNYREVSPMAMTVRQKGKETTLTPFLIDWQKYNKPEFNKFFT
jgi:tellurite resistance protein